MKIVTELLTKRKLLCYNLLRKDYYKIYYWLRRSHSPSINGNQSVDGQAEKSVVKKMHNINFYNLCMCTRSLAGNLSLWSIIQTLVDFSNKIQNGYVEQGMKHKSLTYLSNEYYPFLLSQFDEDTYLD